MCGICGQVRLDLRRPVDQECVRAMAFSIAHRGPDDDGFHFSGAAGLGHRRLTIIDLETGHQPITNEDETLWMIFNGEIYNYQELRADLKARGHRFRTATDSEVILHLYEEHGTDCVKRLRGMFAIAIWDERQRSLFLARDRVGIKPLYYRNDGDSLLFSSELRALLVGSQGAASPAPEAILRFLRYRYLPGRKTPLQGIEKLPPAHWLRLRDGQVEIQRYWELTFDDSRSSHRFQDCVEELQSLLAETVRLHLLSDVPLGFFLSGGVDSTALLSLARQASDEPFSAFTIGFAGEGFEDERPYARLAAKAFRAEHHEISLDAQTFFDTIPDYVRHMEEPVCEPPAISLFHLSRLARDHVKVLISGEGGDEAFAGYPEYRNYYWLERFKDIAGPLSRPLGAVMGGLGRILGQEKLIKYSPLMTSRLEDYYLSRTTRPDSVFNRRDGEIFDRDFLASSNDALAPTRRLHQRASHLDTLQRMLAVDIGSWLPDDLLIKADKMTMAHSLELRVPFLDHRVLEFSATLPRGMKVRGFSLKHILKAALKDHVPREILRRRKSGFPLPYDRWLRGELRSQALDVLRDRRTLSRGYLRRDFVESPRLEGLAERHPKEFFCLLVLELWHRHFIDDAGRTKTRSSGQDPRPSEVVATVAR